MSLCSCPISTNLHRNPTNSCPDPRPFVCRARGAEWRCVNFELGWRTGTRRITDEAMDAGMATVERELPVYFKMVSNIDAPQLQGAPYGRSHGRRTVSVRL